jgi:hypothetical protein
MLGAYRPRVKEVSPAAADAAAGTSLAAAIALPRIRTGSLRRARAGPA